MGLLNDLQPKGPIGRVLFYLPGIGPIVTIGLTKLGGVLEKKPAVIFIILLALFPVLFLFSLLNVFLPITLLFLPGVAIPVPFPNAVFFITLVLNLIISIPIWVTKPKAYAAFWDGKIYSDEEEFTKVTGNVYDEEDGRKYKYRYKAAGGFWILILNAVIIALVTALIGTVICGVILIVIAVTARTDKKLAKEIYKIPIVGSIAQISDNPEDAVKVISQNPELIKTAGSLVTQGSSLLSSPQGQKALSSGSLSGLLGLASSPEGKSLLSGGAQGLSSLLQATGDTKGVDALSSLSGLASNPQAQQLLTSLLGSGLKLK